MPRPIRSQGAPVDGLRALLIRRTERALSATDAAAVVVRLHSGPQLYDFGPEVDRLAARVKALRAGRAVQVARHELPRDAADGLLGRLFELRGERLVPTEYERVGSRD